MAVKAFVLIEVAVAKTEDVVNALTTLQKRVREIKSVDMVTGPYDVIVSVEAADVNAIGDIVTRNIHSVDGIARTVTCLTVRLGKAG